MRLDKYSNPIFNEQDLFDALYKGQPISADMFVENSSAVEQLEKQMGSKFQAPWPDNLDVSINGVDHAHQHNWYMPEQYKNMDIEGFLVSQCPKENYQRLVDELEEFRKRDMLDLLRWLKYFVDTCSKEGVVWGVGRGSSVASYILYLIGVHSIDPIKYNLDWQEFLR